MSYGEDTDRTNTGKSGAEADSFTAMMEFDSSVLFECRSGRHKWMDKDNADHCCNGFKRIMTIITDDANPMKSPAPTFTWVRAE